MKNKTLHNSIYLWRIVFTSLIALLHFNNIYSLGYTRFDIVGGQYIAVEFFFIVSGYLMYKSFLNSKDKKSFFKEYSKKRFFRLFPIFISALIINFFFYCNYNHMDIIHSFTLFIDCFFEFILMSMSGLNNNIIINGPGWYVSALLISCFIISYFLSYHEESYTKFIMPISIMIIYSYFYRKAGGIGVYSQTEFFYLNHALMRAIAGLNLGILSYNLSNYIKKFNFNYLLLSIIEFLLFISVIISSFIVERNNTDFVKILVIFLGVSIAFSHTFSLGRFINFLIIKISAITYSVYLTHNIWRTFIFPSWFTTDYYMSISLKR
mgnify:CR=1 FL=1